MAPPHRLRLTVVLATAGGAMALLFLACSQGGGSARACTPGQQESCACPGGSTGAQVCGSDGTSFGPCTGCPTDGGSSSGGGGSSGSGSGGSSGSSGGDGGDGGLEGGINCGTAEVLDAGTTTIRSCGCDKSFSNTTPCDPAELGGGFCCADPTWPDSGLCGCAGWGCAIAASGLCECDTGYAGQGTTCTGSLCCALGNSSGQCMCFSADSGIQPCSAYGATQVPQCDLVHATSSSCAASTVGYTMPVAGCR
jgi:hypothetical protein